MAINLILSDAASTDEIYLMDGISASIDTTISSPFTGPVGVTHNGTDLLSIDNQSGFVYKHTGFTTTISSSFDQAVGGVSNPTGIESDDGKVFFTTDTNNEEFIKYPDFSSSSISTTDYSGTGAGSFDLTYDGVDIFHVNLTTDEFYQLVGETSAIKKTVTCPTLLCVGITTINGNIHLVDIPSGLNANVYIMQGITSSVDSSFELGWEVARGISCDNVASRLSARWGLQSEII